MMYTIVIPAYRVENDLPRLLDGLLAQTFLDFEVLVIDDHGEDRTAEIAESYQSAFAEKQISYQVVHKEKNEGLSAARNTGLSLAHGEYILFLDGDDEVEANLLETVHAAGAADFLCFGYTEDYYDASGAMTYRVAKHPAAHRFGEGGEPLAEAYAYITALEHQTMFGYAWNKVYRVSFLREAGLSYERISHIEDVLFNLKAADCMQSFITIPDALYHYANRERVRLTSGDLPAYFSLQKQRITAFLDTQSRRLTKEEDVAYLYEVMAETYVRSFFSAVTRDLARGKTKDEIYHQMRQEYESALYRELHRCYRPGSRSTELLYRPIVKGKFFGVYIRARLVGFVQTHGKGLFAKLKQMR